MSTKKQTAEMADVAPPGGVPLHRIALVEDDEDLAFSIAYNLKKAGKYEVQRFAGGLPALEELPLRPPDLLILDLNLPDIDGLSICRELRRNESTKRTPIILLTARAEERDKLLGFELGSDDYVTKPFSMKELLARVNALIRRVSASDPAAEVFDNGRLRIDRSRHLVERSGQTIQLTKKEFDLLWFLVKSRGRVVTRDRILSSLWDYASEVETRTVDVHIRSLRKKIGDDVIETVIGVGYRFPE